MIVHLAGSIYEPEIDMPFLQQIVETIHDHGAVLAHNWLEDAATNSDPADWTPYVETNLDAIKRCDIVIVDLTHYSFSQGFLIAAALEHKKPVLGVSRSKIKGNIASGLVSSLFTYKNYTANRDLIAAVSLFLDKNTIHTKDLRFNMFLTHRIFKYLEETSQSTGKSRSEIIRELVKRKANEDTHA
jgi:hypothetical protein